MRALGCTKKTERILTPSPLWERVGSEGWRRAVKQSPLPRPFSQREKGEKTTWFSLHLSPHPQPFSQREKGDSLNRWAIIIRRLCRLLRQEQNISHCDPHPSQFDPKRRTGFRHVQIVIDQRLIVILFSQIDVRRYRIAIRLLRILIRRQRIAIRSSRQQNLGLADCDFSWQNDAHHARKPRFLLVFHGYCNESCVFAPNAVRRRVTMRRSTS